MIQRYLVLSAVPEFRPDAILNDKNTPEIAVVMPMPTYWEIQELIKQMRFAKLNGLSTNELWRKFSKKVYPLILIEKDRTWYKTNMDF